jgi:hypothetical protein
LLFYEDFETEQETGLDYYQGEGNYAIVSGGYESSHSLELTAVNDNLIMKTQEMSDSLLAMVYRDYYLEQTFSMQRHPSQEEDIVPVELWRLKAKRIIPGSVAYPEATASHTYVKVGEYRHDDGTRESASELSGIRWRKKIIELPGFSATKAILNVLLQENDEVPDVMVSVNGQEIGKLAAANPAEPQTAYVWRKLIFDSSILREGSNTILLSTDDASAGGFWRLGADKDNSGSSFSSDDGENWFERDDELMIFLEIYEIEAVIPNR